MTRDQLEHAIRAACEVSDDNEVIIFGSQSILGTYPDAPMTLRTSIEVDLQPKNLPQNTDLVDGSLGELSAFHHTHGFYVHGVSIEAATLPKDWISRTISVTSPHGTKGNTGHCLEPHDLAASKLFANREKDKIFVITLLLEKLISAKILQSRINSLPIDIIQKNSISTWLRITMEDIS